MLVDEAAFFALIYYRLDFLFKPGLLIPETKPEKIPEPTRQMADG
jgi:hypothetical protein